MWSALALLVLALLSGLAAAGTTMIVRAVVGDLLGRKTWLARPPLSCDLCCAWWTSLGIIGFFAATHRLAWMDAPVVIAAAVGVGVLALKARAALGRDAT